MTSPASNSTRNLGILTLVGFAVVAVLALALTEPDDVQGDLVRIIYVHVPSAITAYIGFTVGAVASGAYLWRRTRFWDLVAHAAIEVGVVFGVLTLLTGMIWGRNTWGTYWEWGDVRLVSTLVMVLIYLGYLALRRVPLDIDARARRSAVLAILAVLMIPIVNRSVEWWEDRTLHQESTLVNLKIEDLTLFTLMLSIVVFVVFFMWITIHRFRVAWLDQQIDELGLVDAIAERRSEAEGAAEAIANPAARFGSNRGATP